MRLVDAHCTIGAGRTCALTPDELVRQLDANGIEAAVACPPDRCLAVANREGNDLVLEACLRHPERLIGFASVNPWYGDAALEELRHAVDAGLRGLTLSPALQGFVVVDSLVDPVLALADELGIPVYISTGTPVHGLPLQVTEVARRFPDVSFLMGRMGHSDFWIDAIPAAAAVPNVYAELSYKQPHTIEQAVAELGADRVVFGSDAPYNELRLEVEKFHEAELDEPTRALVGAENLLSLIPS